MSCFWLKLLCLGLDSEVVMKKATTEISAKLKNIIIVDCDKTALYKKVWVLILKC